MPFDPNAATSSVGAFPGTGANQASPAALGLSAKLAATPVRYLDAPKPGTPVGPLKTGYVNAGPTDIRFDDALSMLDTMGSDEMEQIQRSLYAARLFPTTYYGARRPDIPLGVADSATRSAYTALLKAAVNGKKSLATVLAERTAAAAKTKTPPPDLGDGTSPVTAGTNQPLTVRLTHPNDIASAAETAATKALGRRASQSEIAGMVAAYHAQEVAGQTGAYNANASTTGGTSTDQPNLPGFADNWLRTNNPQAAALNTTGGYIQKVLDLVKGGGTAGG